MHAADCHEPATHGAPMTSTILLAALTLLTFAATAKIGVVASFAIFGLGVLLGAGLIALADRRLRNR